jgi:bacterial leucyl aminopeptidase
VTTVDGTNLAAGKQAKIELTVWSYSSTADKADVYYTANANSPTWTLIGTLSPGGTGARTLSTTYTLPAGALQAVRVNFRYNGVASSCSTGAYDDHDDLIFAVQ